MRKLDIYLGEKVVRENEYRSAMIGQGTVRFGEGKKVERDRGEKSGGECRGGGRKYVVSELQLGKLEDAAMLSRSRAEALTRSPNFKFQPPHFANLLCTPHYRGSTYPLHQPRSRYDCCNSWDISNSSRTINELIHLPLSTLDRPTSILVIAYYSDFYKC